MDLMSTQRILQLLHQKQQLWVKIPLTRPPLQLAGLTVAPGVWVRGAADFK